MFLFIPCCYHQQTVLTSLDELYWRAPRQEPNISNKILIFGLCDCLLTLAVIAGNRFSCWHSHPTDRTGFEWQKTIDMTRIYKIHIYVFFCQLWHCACILYAGQKTGFISHYLGFRCQSWQHNATNYMQELSSYHNVKY